MYNHKEIEVDNKYIDLISSQVGEAFAYRRHIGFYAHPHANCPVFRDNKYGDKDRNKWTFS